MPEPLGGAHRNPEEAASNLEKWIVDTLTDLERFNTQTLVQRRYEKYASMGVFSEPEESN